MNADRTVSDGQGNPFSGYASAAAAGVFHPAQTGSFVKGQESDQDVLMIVSFLFFGFSCSLLFISRRRGSGQLI